VWSPAEEKAGNRPLARQIWAVSLPLILAEVGEIVIHVTDTALLARVGAAELGAIALADEILELWLALAIGLAQGLQIQIARRVGEERSEATLAAFRRGFLRIAVVGAALALALGWISPYLARHLAGSGELGTALGSFMQLAAPGLFLEALNLAYSSLVVGTMRTRILIAVTIQVAATNLVVGYLLIFGRLGLPALGIRGAALAYLAAEFITFLLFTGYAIRRYGAWYRPAGKLSPGGRPNRGILRLSLPVTLDVALESLRWLAFFLIIARISDQALALSNLIYSIYIVLLLPSEAFSDGLTSMVSALIGRGRGDQIRRLVRPVLARCYLATLPLVLTVALYPGTVLSLLAGGLPTTAGDETAVRVAALAVLIVVPAEIWLSALGGAGATDVSFALDMLWTGVFLAWTYLATSAGLPLASLWLGVSLCAVTAMGFAYWWLRTDRWRRRQV
jgi:multidrug resistance protein, MATE family